MPAVIASWPHITKPRIVPSWHNHIGLLPVSDCVSVHGFYSTFTALPVLLWSGFCCFCAALRCCGFWIFKKFFFLYLPFPSPAVERPWPAGSLLYAKTSYEHIWRDSEKKKEVCKAFCCLATWCCSCAYIHRPVLQDVWKNLPAECKCA